MLSAISAGLNEFVHPNPGQKTGKKETGLFGKTRFPEKIAWGSD